MRPRSLPWRRRSRSSCTTVARIRPSPRPVAARPTSSWRRAGGINLFNDLEGNYKNASWEAVVERDPEVIVLIEAGWSTSAEKEQILLTNKAARRHHGRQEQALCHRALQLDLAWRPRANADSHRSGKGVLPGQVLAAGTSLGQHASLETNHSQTDRLAGQSTGCNRLRSNGRRARQPAAVAPLVAARRAGAERSRLAVTLGPVPINPADRVANHRQSSLWH